MAQPVVASAGRSLLVSQVGARSAMGSCQRRIAAVHRAASPAVQQRSFGAQAGGSGSSSSKRQMYAGVAAACLAGLAVAASRHATGDTAPVQCEETVNRGPPRLPDVAKLDARVLDDASVSMRTRMETYVKLLQHRIVQALGKEEPTARFYVDRWLRKEGGEGISCVLQDGDTFEKAGVNISIVHGMLPPRAIAQMSADHAGLLTTVGYKLGLSPGEEADVTGLPFYATGLSLVVHPRNPFAPTVHFNYRYFELTHPPTLRNGKPNPRYDPAEPNKPAAWWFGGGSDLTPIYLFDADVAHFHNTLKQAADAHDTHFYPVWKAWCDMYFWIPHRGEARGVGGIFFDDLTTASAAKDATAAQKIGLAHGNARNPDRLPQTSSMEHTRETLFATVRGLGDAFLPAYLPVLQLRKRMAYTPADEAWQAVRRGRYVEFNLVYDRGTKFGLQTPGARIESILMSLPLRASWLYGHPVSGMGKPDAAEADQWTSQGAAEADQWTSQGAAEAEQARLMDILRSPKEWATA